MPGGWVNRKNIPRGPNGRGLCRWCSLEVPARRFTFCSEYCVHEWKLRSQPGYLREQILKRDGGVCAHCGLDTLREHRRLKRARGDTRAALMRHWGFSTRMRKSLWDADHILPVTEGGGECDLDNIRTLCLRCHRSVTAQLRERIRRAKVAAMLAAEAALGVEAGTISRAFPRTPGSEWECSSIPFYLDADAADSVAQARTKSASIWKRSRGCGKVRTAQESNIW
jgi:5-methylcytosine-specific restriction protein A